MFDNTCNGDDAAADDARPSLVKTATATPDCALGVGVRISNAASHPETNG